MEGLYSSQRQYKYGISLEDPSLRININDVLPMEDPCRSQRQYKCWTSNRRSLSPKEAI